MLKFSMCPDKNMEFETARTRQAVSAPVDLIRVVAVVLVVLLHASIESYTGLTLNAAQGALYWWSSTIYNSLSRVSVPLFVMLSGLLLLQPLKVKEPIKAFLKKRFSRIGLAFGFWSAIYFAWSHFIYNTPLTVTSIIQGLLTGPYYHFWFIYLIAGLYLITPILRVIIAYGERKILRYIIIVWFVGVGVVPLFQLFSGYQVDTYLILIAGWIGYFVLGAYLQKVQLRTSILITILTVGYFWTAYGTWEMTFIFHSLGQYYFFLDSLSVNVIGASVALFILLSRFRFDWPGTSHPYVGKVAHAISVNALPIYLLQLIVLESLHKGFLGFKISLWTMNPIIEIPLATFVGLFITLGLVLLMRRVPGMKKIIGAGD